MSNLSQIKADSNWGDASNTINTNFQNMDVEVEKLKNSTTRFKGYFTNETNLKNKFPSPKRGDIAFVGEPYPGNVYDVLTDGSWHNTAKAPETGSVDLQDYVTNDDFEASQKEQDDKLTELESYALHSRPVFGEDAQYYNVLENGQGGTKKELNGIFKSLYISKKLTKPYIERYYDSQLVIKDEENNSYSIPLSFDNSLNENLIVSKIVNDIQFIILYNPSKRINGGFYNSTYDKTKLSDDVFLNSDLKNMYDIKTINNYTDNGDFIDFTFIKEKKSTNNLIGSDGDPVPVDINSSVYGIKVQEGQRYRIKLTLKGSGNTQRRGYALYSDNKISSTNFISGSEATAAELDIDEIVEIPKNCSLLAWSERSTTGKVNVYYLTAIKDIKEESEKNKINIQSIKEQTPFNSEKSKFGVLPNTQGITEDEAKNIFSELVVSEDVKTYYINYSDSNNQFTITLKRISDDEIYGTILVDADVDDFILYPIIDTTYALNNKILKGYAIINAANIARASFGNYYVYFDGNKKIYQNKMSLFKNIIEIILWGDSLTALGSGYGEFFSYPGKIISDFGVGGENTLQILGRIGASPYLIRENIIIPNNTDDEVSILLKSSWNGSSTMPRATYGLNECTINGIKGSIKVVSAGNTATFKRSEAGEQIEVKAGTEVLPYYYKSVQTQFNVYWIGQNGGWSTPNELVEQFKAIAANQANGMFLFITPHLNTNDELEDMMQKEFGLRYINMRKWCVLYGLQESGIEARFEDNEAISLGNCPPSLLGDGTHFIESTKKAQAKMIKERIEDLFNFID